MSLEAKDLPKNIVATLAFGCTGPLLLEMREAIALLTAVAADRMQRYGAATGKVSVWVETGSDNTEPQHEHSRTATLPIPIGDARLLALFTRDIVDEVYRPGQVYQKAGVSCEDLMLDDRASASCKAAAGTANERARQLARVMACIRDRYGPTSVVVVNEGSAMRRWQSVYPPRSGALKLAEYAGTRVM